MAIARTIAYEHHERWDPLEAKIEITRQRGHQFSPRIVDIFNARYDEIEAIRERYTD